MKKNASTYTLLEDAISVLIVIVGTAFILLKALIPPLILFILLLVMIGGLPPDTL